MEDLITQYVIEHDEEALEKTAASGSLPDDWNPRPIDIKSGWKHNANTLAKIVTAINDETYVEDENAET